MLSPVFQNAAFDYYHNRRRGDIFYPPQLHKFLPPDKTDDAAAIIKQWRGYAPTPLYALPNVAALCNVGGVYYKDESARFGIGSFKALGAGYAVNTMAKATKAKTAKTTIAAATDGNHGRAVAWAAQRMGCQCRIYLHAGVSGGRQKAIEKFGAIITRIDGNYDDSLRAALADSRANGWKLISDTVCGSLRRAPGLVMAGYGLMADEVIDQMPPGVLPSHLFAQGGVGGFAAAMCARFWHRLGKARGRFAVVEPDMAACLLASARAGKSRAVMVREETVMAGLSCGEPSSLALPVLLAGAHDFVAIPDAVVAPAMKILHDNKPRIIAGESAVAGLALLLMAAAQPKLYRHLGLSKTAVILLFGTEGATDAKIYKQMIGK
ncbi:MAG: diaminopropionate ammonia-lyase [Gammaproteobacteria bacterium]